MSTTFAQRLDSACEASRSLVCVGLDPDLSMMPVKDVAAFNKAIVDATHDLVGAYKPNLAFYEALGLDGWKALESTVQHIRDAAPGVILLGDAKRGDIGNTAVAYARGMFEYWGFDAVTINAYCGRDGVEPFLEYSDRGVFVLCRSSNPGAVDLQDLVVSSDTDSARPLYQQLALQVGEWDRHGNAGLVLGATYPEQIKEVRALCPDMPFLIPGIGPQEGALEEAVRNGVTVQGRRILVNSSRGITYASRGDDFAEAARKATADLRDAINDVLASVDAAW